MSDQVHRELARARRELGGVEVLIEAGYPEVAISRGYYAVFHAATAALLVLGEARSKHSGVVSAFGQLVVHERGFDRRIAKPLRDLFEVRNRVDYWLEGATTEDARKRLGEAQRFVAEVERWIESRAAAE